MYPIAQSLFPGTNDRETEERIKRLMERQSHRQTYKLSLMYDGEPTIEMLSEIGKGRSTFDLDMYRIRAVADYQFGEGAALEFAHDQDQGQVDQLPAVAAGIAPEQSPFRDKQVLAGAPHPRPQRADEVHEDSGEDGPD